MNFLIEHQYIILYFSGAFFSFFAMISYVKFGNSFIGGRKKLDSSEDFFGEFDNDDLEALLDESFDVDEGGESYKASGADRYDLGEISFAGGQLEIANDDVRIESRSDLENTSKGK